MDMVRRFALDSPAFRPFFICARGADGGPFVYRRQPPRTPPPPPPRISTTGCRGIATQTASDLAPPPPCHRDGRAAGGAGGLPHLVAARAHDDPYVAGVAEPPVARQRRGRAESAAHHRLLHTYAHTHPAITTTTTTGHCASGIPSRARARAAAACRERGGRAEADRRAARYRR